MRKCPREGNILKESEFLGITIDACPTCSGAWLDQGELAAITRADQDIIGPPQEGKPGAIKCPDCGILMEEMHFSPERKILIDRCPQCKGIWADQNEIMGAIKAAFQQKNA